MKLRILQPLDFTAGGLALALVAVIGAVILVGSWEGVQVNLVTSGGNGEIGPLSPILLRFSEPVDQTVAQLLFSIRPETSGKLDWMDARTLRFTPQAPFRPGTDYQIQVRAGYLGNKSLLLRFNHLWVLHVRQPQIAYLASINNNIQLWTVDPDGRYPHRLGNFNKAIFDFDAAPDGEYLVFSALNDKQGADLWYVDRNGNSLQPLVPCGADRCTSPAISPDSRQVAYTRETAPIAPGMPTGAPRIWVVNVQSGEDRPLYSDPQIIGFGPGWSPDGKYITSYDGVQAVIRVAALATGEQFTLPSATGGEMPAWSPDSQNILFTDEAASPDGSSSWTEIKMANVATGDISVWIGKNDTQDYQYGELAWAADPNEIIIGLKLPPDFTSRGLLLVQPNDPGGPTVARDPQYVYQTPKWDPWGNEVLFQEEMISGQHTTNIALWEMGMSQPRVVAQGTWPHWLP
ncbi:MAG TPA: hypothetical protein VLZ89_17090 [Anaerolineales bacterium]|nr:hypothetical protein [Anaerolineales bacterium]